MNHGPMEFNSSYKASYNCTSLAWLLDRLPLSFPRGSSASINGLSV